MIPSVEEQRAFARATADRCNEVESETYGVDEVWHFEWMVSVDEMAEPGAPDNLREIQSTCKGGLKAVLTSAVLLFGMS